MNEGASVTSSFGDIMDEDESSFMDQWPELREWDQSRESELQRWDESEWERERGTVWKNEKKRSKNKFFFFFFLLSATVHIYL